MHATALNLERKPNSTSKLLQTPIDKALYKVDNEEESRVSKLLDITYLIAKEELPFSMLPAIAELEKWHGVNLGETYVNDKKCNEFSACIAETLWNDLIKELESAHYISIMVDESTDTCTKEKLLVYARYVGLDGTVKTKFVALRDIHSGKVEGILSCVLKIFSDYGISEISEKLVAFCSDGASVNLGARNGLAVKLREKCPWLVVMHCLNHRLELAVKDSMTKTYFETVITMLTNLYGFYKRSPKRTREITELAVIFQEEENSHTYSPTNVQGTRWTDHKKRAANALIKSYNIVIAHIENSIEQPDEGKAAKGKLTGYLRILMSGKFVFYLLLMAKVCDALAKLSLAFQQDSCNLLHAKIYFKKFEDTIEKLELSPLESNSSIDMQLAAVLKGDDFCNRKLTGSLVDKDVAVTYLKDLKERISHRFPDMTSDTVKCLKVLDVALWPKDSDSLKRFGQDEIRHMIQHFALLLQAKKVDTWAIEEEWGEHKEFWLQNMATSSREDLWFFILKSKRNIYSFSSF